MVKRGLLVLLLFLFTVATLTQTAPDERVLRIGLESDIRIPGPWESPWTYNSKIFWNVFEPLVALDEKSTRVVPCLATSWKASNNNRIWVFTLRKGVKFHDGSNLTADDVVASVKLFPFFDGKIEKIDQYSIRFSLPNPNSNFLNKLTHIRYAIAPSKTVQDYLSLKKENKLNEFIPIGSGPFKFSHWEKEKTIVLESFVDYWQGSPWLDRLMYTVELDNTARLIALEQGRIDLLDVLSPSDLPRIRRNSNLRIQSMYGMNVCFILLNVQLKPMDNKKIRQAISLAIDKLTLTEMFYYGGYGVPTNRILSPAFWGFSALPSPGRYRPEEARKLLAEAGYNKNSVLNMDYMSRARPYLPDPLGMAEEIKRQLAQVGVKVKLSDHHEQYELGLDGYINESSDPDYTFNYLLERWQNKSFEDKLQVARMLPLNDIRGRIRLYNEAQGIVQEEVPWIPLFHTKIFIIYNRKVKGIMFYPSSMISYHKVRF